LTLLFEDRQNEPKLVDETTSSVIRACLRLKILNASKTFKMQKHKKRQSRMCAGQ